MEFRAYDLGLRKFLYLTDDHIQPFMIIEESKNTLFEKYDEINESYIETLMDFINNKIKIYPC